MTISKKHCIAIAENLSKTYPDPNTVREENSAHYQWAQDCVAVADAIASHMPRFNREKFLKACGAE